MPLPVIMEEEDLPHGRHGRRTNVHVGMLVRDTVGVGAAYPDEGALVFGMFRFREFFQCGEVFKLCLG